MVAREFWEPAVAEIIFCGRALTVVRLECTHDVFRIVRPEASFFRVVIEILLKRVIAFARHREIAGQNVVQRRNIGRSLDRRMTPERKNPAAGPANISKQQLQNRGRANDLHAFRMLSPTDGVADRSGPLRTGCSSERMRHLVKKVRRNAADFLDHLRCVAREVPFQFLKDGLRILQCEIALRAAQIAAFVKPTVAFVSTLLCVPAGEIAVSVIFRVAVFVGQNARGIRVMNDVIAKEELIFDQVVDESAEKNNVCAGTDRHPDIGQRAGARKSWIHMDDCGAALLCFHHPAKTDWMRLGHR